MLQHERTTPVLLLPPNDTTSLDLGGPWISMQEHHSITFYCMVGKHNNDVTFKVRKYNQTNKARYRNREVPGVFHEFRRYWRNSNTDATESQCLSLHLVQNDSTASTSQLKHGYGNAGLLRGELIIIEISADALGKDASGDPYDMVQLTVQGSPTGPSHIAAMAILQSMPKRY